jgi:hypothetical protein
MRRLVGGERMVFRALGAYTDSGSEVWYCVGRDE